MKQLVILVILALATQAAAETKVDALFKKGKQQLADKQYAQACATFEQVDKLEPGIGAKLNIANCYEQWEKLAVAYRWYADAQKMAIDTKDKRVDKIKELIDALDADVPRLTIKLPAKIDPEAAAVQLDGKPFSELGTELRVDPGPHVIDYTSGTTAKKKTVTLERGASTEVELVFDPGATLIGQKPPPPPSTGSNRKVIGLAAAGTGVIALGVAGVLTLSARSKYNTALDEHCLGETDLCDAEGLSATTNARKRANHATIISLVGVAAVATGVVLYVTAPKGKESSEKRAYVAPSVSPTSAAVIFGGRF